VPGDPNPTAEPRPTAIDGALIQPLSWFDDQRGGLSVLLRGDQPHLHGERFGQAYITTVLPGVVKAWHRHEKQWDRMVGLLGRTLLVLQDGRADSPTRGATVEVIFSQRQHQLVLIPPGVWHGLKALSVESMVLNLPDQPYSVDAPDEQRFAPHDSPIPGQPAYDWARRDG
jgi:dTDP-4-dehydrorhamnose 3,5-epimerase